MEKNKVIETEVIEVEEVKTGSKFWGGVKKHGKKIAVGVVIGIATLLGYAVGKKSSGKTEYNDDEVYETTDFSEVDSNE